MAAAAHIERAGVPIDVLTLSRLRESWQGIQQAPIDRIDTDYGVYEGRVFKAERFRCWLDAAGIPWPRLPSGALSLADDTFREMARAQPRVAPLRELRSSLAELRLNDLAVGPDGRNRTLLSAFRASSGRNAPSSARYIFGPSTWLRALIKPPPGFGVAYVDWEQQEFGIAAALSGDALMREAYESADPYLRFAQQAGAVPEYATKVTHPTEREQFKACTLAVQYGMEAQSLAQRIGQPVSHARELLRLHKRTYRRFWAWSDGAVDHALLRGRLWSVFGWQVHASANANPRSLRNFPMQANGAEMLRTACVFGIEADIRIVAPVHDAILIEAPLTELDEHVRLMQRLMSDASAVVLSGFRLRTEPRLVCYPDRYMDKRGERMWQVVTALLKGAGDAVTNRDTFVSANVLRHVTQPVTEHNTRSVFFI